MAGVKGMVTRWVEPPEGARKVPNFRLWAERDGTMHGPYGPKKLRTNANSAAINVSAVDDAGREFNVSVAQMVARAWLPPRPPNSKLVHLDGDQSNNSAANLAWAPKQTNGEKCQRWKARYLPSLQADPHDPRHGTRTGYAIGCRCKECRNAAMIYARTLETKKTIKKVEECLKKQGRAR